MSTYLNVGYISDPHAHVASCLDLGWTVRYMDDRVKIIETDGRLYNVTVKLDNGPWMLVVTDLTNLRQMLTSYSQRWWLTIHRAIRTGTY